MQPDIDSRHKAEAGPVEIVNLDSLRKLLGCEFTARDWLTITQDKIQSFAEVTEDRQWIHVDPGRAQRESPYKTTVAHGFLTLSLLSYFLSETIRVRSGELFVVNYGLEKVRFPSPVRTGEQIRCRFLLRSIDDIAGGCHAIYSATVEIRNGSKPCCVAEWVVCYYSST